MKQYEVIVEKTATGYSAYAQEHEVYTTGATLAELKANVVEAFNLYFEEAGKKVTPEEIKVVLDLPQFFEFYKEINASALSKRIGMPQSLLAQYISGRKKPSLKQTQRILDGVKALGRELVEIDFA